MVARVVESVGVGAGVGAGVGTGVGAGVGAGVGMDSGVGIYSGVGVDAGVGVNVAESRAAGHGSGLMCGEPCGLAPSRIKAVRNRLNPTRSDPISLTHRVRE